MQLEMKEVENLLYSRHYESIIEALYAQHDNLKVGTIGFINEPQTYTNEDTEGDETSTGVGFDEALNTDPDPVAESTELGTGSEPEGVREASDMVDSCHRRLDQQHDETSPGDTDIQFIEVEFT